MWTNLFKHIDIDPANVHLLDGNAADLQAECDAYEEAIKAVGGIELFLAGEFGVKSGWRDRYCALNVFPCWSFPYANLSQALGQMDTLPSMSRGPRFHLVPV